MTASVRGETHDPDKSAGSGTVICARTGKAAEARADATVMVIPRTIIARILECAARNCD
jgi:hypothetical protein